jgi:hypothetical protein
MAESVRITSKPIRRQYPDSAVILDVVTIGRKSGNTISPPEGKNNFSIQLKSAITEDEYNRLEASGVTSIGRGEINGREVFYSVVGIIEDNKISATDATPENVERDLPNLKTEAIDAINEEITNEGSKVSPTVPSNVASTNTQTQEVSSTPVSTATGSGVKFGKIENALIRKYPLNISDAQDCIEFTVFEYADRDITSAGNALNPFQSTGGGSINKGFKRVGGAGSVYLPITKISDTNSVNWNEDSLNEFQRYLAGVSLGTMQSGGEGVDTVTNALTTLREGMGNIAEFAIKNNAFGNYVRSFLAGQAVGANNLVTRSTGALLNPNMELLFNGPLLRQFQFSFDLIGKNKEEASIIKSIIRFFKKNMAVRETPTVIGSEVDSNEIGQGNSVFLNSPYVFQIKYLQGADRPGATRPQQSIGQIKMCALQNFTTDYTPMGSFMTFNDEERTMFMYRISMAFKELTPIYDSDYVSSKDSNGNDNPNYHPIGF